MSREIGGSGGRKRGRGDVEKEYVENGRGGEEVEKEKWIIVEKVVEVVVEDKEEEEEVVDKESRMWWR